MHIYIRGLLPRCDYLTRGTGQRHMFESAVAGGPGLSLVSA